MNETILRFGYPETLIARYDHWLVLLRPDQPTLGSLVIASVSEARRLSELPPAAFAELGRVIADTEPALLGAVRYDKLNYLMLMMVDPHVHWHVIPRYAGERETEGIRIRDSGWPKIPQLGEALSLTPEQIGALRDWLSPRWRRS
ncbi:MAG TPA: HIT family protein [Allosphingosinicella sp.]|nr:HIT family protein [Allosphingosinicella sp.]